MTRVELLFDDEGVRALTEVVEGLAGEFGVPVQDDRIPVLPALRPVVPGGGLRPGSAVSLAGAGAATLGVALVAGVAQGDGWCATVGIPEFGVVAATQMGADPQRLLLVDHPGERWADVVAALTEAVDLILLRPPEQPGAAAVRRLTALARRSGCVLAVPGAWEGARLRLRVETSVWTGLGDGHGRLGGRRARIVAEGRGIAGPPARSWVWLPGPDGTVTPVAEPPATGRPGDEPSRPSAHPLDRPSARPSPRQPLEVVA